MTLFLTMNVDTLLTDEKELRKIGCPRFVTVLLCQLVGHVLAQSELNNAIFDVCQGGLPTPLVPMDVGGGRLLASLAPTFCFLCRNLSGVRRLSFA